MSGRGGPRLQGAEEAPALASVPAPAPAPAPARTEPPAEPAIVRAEPARVSSPGRLPEEQAEGRLAALSAPARPSRRPHSDNMEASGAGRARRRASDCVISSSQLLKLPTRRCSWLAGRNWATSLVTRRTSREARGSPSWLAALLFGSLASLGSSLVVVVVVVVAAAVVWGQSFGFNIASERSLDSRTGTRRAAAPDWLAWQARNGRLSGATGRLEESERERAQPNSPLARESSSSSSSSSSPLGASHFPGRQTRRWSSERPLEGRLQWRQRHSRDRAQSWTPAPRSWLLLAGSERQKGAR